MNIVFSCVTFGFTSVNPKTLIKPISTQMQIELQAHISATKINSRLGHKRQALIAHNLVVLYDLSLQTYRKSLACLKFHL